MKNFKILSQIILSTIFLFILIYGFLRIFLFGINNEFVYLIKGLTDDKISNDIVVIEIDDLTLNKLGFPFKRENYTKFVNNLSLSNPAVIGIDILFADKGNDINEDNNLAKSFKNAGNIVIGFDINNLSNIIPPYELLAKSVSKLGYLRPNVNTQTGKVYSISPNLELSNKGKKEIHDSFSFAILREYFNYLYDSNQNRVDKISFLDKYYNFFTKKIPIYYKDFYILFNDFNSFKRESFYNVYSGNFNKEIFRDKIVLIGYTAQGVKDYFFVPGLKNNVTLKGVYIHANVLNNVLTENYVIFFNKNYELLIGFIFIFIITFFNVIYNKEFNLRWIIFGSILIFLFVLIMYLFVFNFIYKNSGIFFIPNYPLEFLFVLLLSFFMSSVLKYFNEDKNKKMLSKALSEYVSVDITKEILYSKGEVNLSGENKKITIFFSDIAGFTTISEKLTPEQLVSFLRVYLGDMSNIIMDKKGFINKYEGDAIMALWGVFGKVEKFGVIDSCESCLLQQEKLSILNQKWSEEGKDELYVRMGLHTGNAIIGNIGSEGRKMEFTALGDSVNLASRLEGVNKIYNTNICCSEDVYIESNEKYFFRYLDKIRVKGKNNGVKIYELIGRIGEIDNYKLDIINDFNNGILFYIKKDFIKAREIFEKLSLVDNPSKIYLQRCEEFLLNPPSNDWDGIYVMKTK
ncbi:MAG: adenylate/guanylate cyclase domain-containing protein [Candidatus Gracilibacteria bacterium]|nr:adenylate/guanylate cyclase domain-containing protein [Candidatus Gracilibacteria bacterium]